MDGARLITAYMTQKNRKEVSQHGFTLIEFTVNLQPDVDTEDVHTLVGAVTSSEYAQALLVLGFEACALDVGSFTYTLNCFKGAVSLQNLQVCLHPSSSRRVSLHCAVYLPLPPSAPPLQYHSTRRCTSPHITAPYRST